MDERWSGTGGGFMGSGGERGTGAGGEKERGKGSEKGWWGGVGG